MKSQDGITRICLWSGPRNISTTLMYSFAQREDTTVFDEPLYAHYLCNTNADEYHPGAEDVISSQENDGQKVVENNRIFLISHHFFDYFLSIIFL